MDSADFDDQLAGARAYEDLHVPALFGEWAPRVLDAAAVGPGDRVLDVACGTGVLAREARVRVGAGGSVSALDPGPAMLAVARELAPDVEWREGVAESLPYPDQAFDAVFCQFGLMFFGNRALALKEMMRVLRPGGRLAIAVWDSLENTKAYATEVDLLERLAGRAAADALRAPFVLGDSGALSSLLEDSGAEAVRVMTYNGRACFPSIRTMVEADLRGWLPVMGVLLEEERIEKILDEAETALARYVSAEGQVVFDSPAHIATGTRRPA